jgi:hypothetical protein
MGIVLVLSLRVNGERRLSLCATTQHAEQRTRHNNNQNNNTIMGIVNALLAFALANWKNRQLIMVLTSADGRPRVGLDMGAEMFIMNMSRQVVLEHGLPESKPPTQKFPVESR